MSEINDRMERMNKWNGYVNERVNEGINEGVYG